jgi:hypothetical protein
MEAPFIYFALDDPFELIDISEKCKVNPAIVIKKDEG